MNKFLCFTVLLAIASYGNALKCYTCDYDFDKDCVGEGVDTGAIPSINDPDADNFQYCFKASFDSDKRAHRGGIDEYLLDDLKDTYSVKNGECKSGQDYSDDNRSYDDASICVCDSDHCNGSGAVTVSIVTLLMAVIAKYIC